MPLARITPQRRNKAPVTGGAGFLGSHLCDRLLADSHNVLCVDNLLLEFITDYVGMSLVRLFRETENKYGLYLGI
jgi:nucleoside-diphosphate-sugar epimerase